MKKAAVASLAGAHPVSLSRWLKNRVPETAQLMKLADVLRVRYQWLLTGEEPMRAGLAQSHGESSIIREEAALMASTPQEAMRTARIARGLTFKDLAKLTRYRADVLQAIEEGNGKASEKMIEAIARELQLSKEALMSGQHGEANGIHGTYGSKPNVVGLGDVGTPRYVPLISMAQAGQMSGHAFTDGGYDYEATVVFDPKDTRAFGVRIAGESMQPVFSAGDIAIVYPSQSPRSGDHVIARLTDEAGGDVLFKIYTARDGGQRLILSSHNPAFPPMELGRSQLLWIYPVVSVNKPLRR